MNGAESSSLEAGSGAAPWVNDTATPASCRTDRPASAASGSAERVSACGTGPGTLICTPCPVGGMATEETRNGRRPAMLALMTRLAAAVS